MRIKGLSHIAMAVANLDEALEQMRSLLGIEASCREVVASQKTEVALLDFGPGQTALELICPARSDRPEETNQSLVRFLAKRGPGLHHISVQVENLADALAELKAKGGRLVDETGRPGARGHQVAFVHPSTFGGLLVELEERS